MKGTLALLAVVVGLAVAVPAFAEDFFVGGRAGGVGVGVDVNNGYHRNWDGDRVYRRTEGFDRVEGVERCRTTIIRHEDGSVRKIRRCRD
jgi:hypothetical protein